MLQDFRAALQHPDLALCRKDINTLLGEMDAEAATLDYQSIAPEVFELLSSRMVVGHYLSGHLLAYRNTYSSCCLPACMLTAACALAETSL